MSKINKIFVDGTVLSASDLNPIVREVNRHDGIEYNESTSGVTIGDKTIASSADQLVFGKYNVEDSEKIYAEIVGGGVEDSTTLCILEGYTRLGSTITEIELIVTDEDVQKNQYDFDSEIGDYKDIAQTIKNDVNFTKIRKVTTTRKSYNSHSYLYVCTGLTDSDNVLYTLAYYKDVDDTYKTDAFYDVTINEVSGYTAKNIRTLDWTGNETIEGDLTVRGGDIKFGTTNSTYLSEADVTKLKLIASMVSFDTTENVLKIDVSKASLNGINILVSNDDDSKAIAYVNGYKIVNQDGV